MLGQVLVTHQTGEEGRLVNQVLVAQGVDIAKEYYLAILMDRATGVPVVIASTEGGVNIEDVAEHTPEKISRELVASDARVAALPGAENRAGPRVPRRAQQTGVGGDFQSLQAVHGVRLLDGRGQPAGAHARQPGARAGRQVQFRRQRALPAQGNRRDARRGRGRPARGGGQQVQPQLHRAGRRHRLPGQRRGAGDGDDGHHQVSRRQPGQLPGRGGWRERAAGDRGVQDSRRATRT